jgi:hypothetical protein
MSFPDCYLTLDEYKAWRKAATMAKESAAPCTDCTKEFRAAMTTVGRCHPTEVRMNFSVIRRFEPTITESES